MPPVFPSFRNFAYFLFRPPFFLSICWLRWNATRRHWLLCYFESTRHLFLFCLHHHFRRHKTFDTSSWDISSQIISSHHLLICINIFIKWLSIDPFICLFAFYILEYALLNSSNMSFFAIFSGARVFLNIFGAVSAIYSTFIQTRVKLRKSRSWARFLDVARQDFEAILQMLQLSLKRASTRKWS